MPVRARMPSKRFYRAWLEKNPDLTCVQRGCDLRVDPILTASFPYAFTVCHNDDTFYIYGNFNVPDDLRDLDFVERLREELGRTRHKGDPDPADEFLIVRG